MKYLYTFILCYFTTIIYGQSSIETSVISNTGGINSNTSNSISFTIGETFVTTITNTSSIAQGFWASAASLNTLSTEDVELNDAAITLYPNPVIDSFILKTTITDDYTVLLFNSNGQQLLKKEIAQSSLENQIDISTLAKGIYVLSISNSKQHKKIKLIKQ